MIFKALEKNFKLKVLNLSNAYLKIIGGNNIGDDSNAILETLYQKNNSLEDLNLSDNPIKDIYKRPIMEVSGVSSTLKLS